MSAENESTVFRFGSIWVWSFLHRLQLNVQGRWEHSPFEGLTPGAITRGIVSGVATDAVVEVGAGANR